ncbi:MAG: cytochrome c biogenesis CcdA family protein [Proteobacteria bacterium]|nr:cytochrome c biogenesis CcdA family protein [Pseudomonadota bacterium]
MDLNFSSLVLVLVAGLTSVASPCVLPVIPIIVTGSTNDHKLRPLLIVIGLATSFIIMGLVSSLFVTLIAGNILYVEKIVGIIIMLFGVMMLFDLNVFKRISFLSNLQVSSQGRWSGLILGISLGIVWIPCVGPILSGVLGMVATQETLRGGIWLLLIYTLGFSVPILIAGYGSHFFRTRLSLIQQHPKVVRSLGGVLLVVFGAVVWSRGMLVFN